MAIQISGTTVINDSKAIQNIVSYSGDGVATQAEAEAGTNNDQLMTPLRVKQAIEAMGSQLPDIQTEGWPGTDKGHLGFGWNASWVNSMERSMYGGASNISQTWGTQGSSATTDITTRGTNAWAANRSKVAAGTGVNLSPCGPVYFQGSNTSTYMVFQLVTPTSMEGRTLDIYWGSSGNTNNGQEITSANSLSYFPLNRGNGREENALPATRTSWYQDLITGASRMAIARARISNMPDICGIRIFGSASQSYNGTYPTICYYEIY